MNNTYAAAFAAELALVTRTVPVPTGELKYGRDLSCVTDLDPALAEVDEASPAAIVEAIVRRFITPRDALEDDPSYGLDVRGQLNRGITLRDLRALSGALQGEAQKDDRVLQANVQVNSTLGSGALSIAVAIVPADPVLQPFSFTIAVASGDDLKVTINGN
jgi:hypothetical protein